MSKSARAMVRVFGLRERRSRLALARITQDIDEKRGLVHAAGNMLGAIGAQMKATSDSRFSAGARTVAALLDSEQHARVLRETQGRIAGLKQQAEQALEALAESRRKLARQWYRDETKLTHADAYGRRVRATHRAQRTEADDEEHASTTLSGRGER